VQFIMLLLLKHLLLRKHLATDTKTLKCNDL